MSEDALAMVTRRRHAAATGRQRGFAYLALLLFVAAFGAISASVVAAGSALAQRAAEDELLFVGGQFRNAIRSYYESGAGGRRYPVSLDELLRDPRFPGLHRHLRRIYRDPLTGLSDWGVVLAPEGLGIVGVYSKAAGKPLKVDGFATEFVAFKGAMRYAEWVFTYAPQAAPAGTLPGLPGAAPPAAAASGP